MKKKIGIIGTGGISHFHMKGYLKDERCEVVAVCDINEKRVEEFAKKYNVKRAYTDYKSMLDNEKLDAVSVCTWNSQHAPCTIEALNKGVCVLCEKPMAINYQEAKEMKKAAEDNNVLLMVGFVRRFGNDAKILDDFINQNYFGDIYYAKATYLRRNGCPGGWFGDKSRSGGGPLIDLGVHVIDLVRYLMRCPKAKTISAATFDFLKKRNEVKTDKAYLASDQEDIFDVEDLATCMIRFDNGSVLQVETSFSLNIKEDTGNIELFGTKAGAKLSPELEIYGVENGYMTNVNLDAKTALSFDGLFENEIIHFIDCLYGEVECKSPAEDGVELMKIIDKAYKSAKEGKEIEC